MADATGMQTRSIDLSIEIDAPVDVVWRAISEADELIRWFPMEAEIEPRVGGRLWVSWGEGLAWTSRIEVWEPNRRQRSVTEPPEGAAASAESGDAAATPVQVAVEYTLEARGGRTVLRLVHSGFDAAAEWDTFYDATERGWTYFLRHLRHYIERHRGVARRVMRWRRPFTIAAAEMWKLLGDPSALGFASVRAGSAWSIPRLAGGDATGEVWMAEAPWTFAGTIPDLDDAVLFVEIEPGMDGTHCGVWLSTYGLDEQRCAALQRALDQALDPLPVDGASPS